MDIEWNNRILTIIVIILVVFQVIHIIFSIYSYFYLRNKQFAPCSKGEYRGVQGDKK